MRAAHLQWMYVLYVQTPINGNVYMDVCINTIYIDMYVYVRESNHSCVFLSRHLYTHIYIYRYIYIYICMCIYIHYVKKSTYTGMHMRLYVCIHYM